MLGLQDKGGVGGALTTQREYIGKGAVDSMHCGEHGHHSHKRR